MHRLKEGIRFNPLEFYEEKEHTFYPRAIYDISSHFANKVKLYYRIDEENYIVGELSLFLTINDLLYPICIVSDYTLKYLGSTLLIDKNFFGNNKEINNEIVKIIDLLKKRGYKFSIIKNLRKYIFEDIKLPDFKTLENMNEWLEEIKKKWLTNERRKIRKLQKENNA